MTIDVSEFKEELKVLERLYYEIAGRENVINFLIKTGDKDTEYFSDLWEEYLSYLKAYQEMKTYFQINCIMPKINYSTNFKWSINFMTKEVLITNDI